MTKKILITAPVHQDAKIFKEYLWSLNRLIIPEGYEIQKHFYLHNADNLKKFLQPNEYEIFKDETKVEESDVTHIWKQENFNAVTTMRTKALEYARENNFDYIFSVDSDVILQSTNLVELINSNKDIVAKMYWTIFDSNIPYFSMPNCYDYINEKGQRVFKKGINNLKFLGLHEVGVTGACTLIGKRIINEPLIDYFPIKIFSYSKWEDYAFCIKAHALIPDVSIYIDNMCSPKHLYRKEDYTKWVNEEKEKWN